jgi:hypothetical protein
VRAAEPPRFRGGSADLLTELVFQAVQQLPVLEVLLRGVVVGGVDVVLAAVHLEGELEALAVHVELQGPAGGGVQQPLGAHLGQLDAQHLLEHGAAEGLRAVALGVASGVSDGRRSLGEEVQGLLQALGVLQGGGGRAAVRGEAFQEPGEETAEEVETEGERGRTGGSGSAPRSGSTAGTRTWRSG